MKFDPNTQTIEKYLHTIYSRMTSKFYHLCRDRGIDGVTIEEVKEKHPDVYQVFKDACDFTDYTEKFLGYTYKDYGFVYIGKENG